jgi:hypothetical protein
MWVDNKPTHVYASQRSVKRDYDILKSSLPIPIGIDHLNDETLQNNKILSKMNLLDVGVINDIKLENNRIKITDSKITNPTVQELYNKGELPSFSVVSDLYSSKCGTGKADKVEEYSVIKRVDFVEKGACTECKVDLPNSMAQIGNAKAVINGDESMATDPNQNPAPDAGTNPDDGSKPEPATLDDVVKAIGTLGTKIDKMQVGITALEGKAGIKEPTPDGGNQEQPPATPAAASNADEDPNEARIVALENEIKASKAQAQKAEASAIVNTYLKEGKVAPAETEAHVAMAMATPEQYKTVMDKAPVIIDMEKHSAQGSGSDSTGLTDENGEEVDLEKTSKEMDKLIGDA